MSLQLVRELSDSVGVVDEVGHEGSSNMVAEKDMCQDLGQNRTMDRMFEVDDGVSDESDSDDDPVIPRYITRLQRKVASGEVRVNTHIAGPGSSSCVDISDPDYEFNPDSEESDDDTSSIFQPIPVTKNNPEASKPRFPKANKAAYVMDDEVGRHDEQDTESKILDDVEIGSLKRVPSNDRSGAVGNRPSTITSGLRFRCSKCPFKSNLKVTLLTHLLIHSRKYPAYCYICNVGITKLCRVNAHFKLKHPQKTRGQEWYIQKCYSHRQIIKPGFRLAGNTIIPIKKEEKCLHCPYATTEMNLLRKHMIQHKRQYKCRICRLHFGQKGVLITHVKRIHGKDMESKNLGKIYPDSDEEEGIQYRSSMRGRLVTVAK